MQESSLEAIQNLASGKAATGITVGSAAIPWWIQFINGDALQAIIVVTSILVSLSIIAVNIQAFIYKYKKVNESNH